MLVNGYNNIILLPNCTMLYYVFSGPLSLCAYVPEIKFNNKNNNNKRRRLPVRGSRSCWDLPFVPWQWPIPSWCSWLSGPSGQTVSFQLNFGLLLGRFPFTYISTTARMFSVSSLLLTCPNRSSLLLLITIAIGSKISSFLRCSKSTFKLLTYAFHLMFLLHMMDMCHSKNR